MNQSVFVSVIRPAKAILCCTAVASIYAACLVVLPAKAEDCLFPKPTQAQIEAGGHVGDFWIDPPIRRSQASPSVRSSQAFPFAEVVNENKPSAKRSIILPGCRNSGAGVPPLDSNDAKAVSSTSSMSAQHSISPILNGFCEFEISQILHAVNRVGVGAVNFDVLPPSLKALYPQSELIPASPFVADGNLQNEIRVWTGAATIHKTAVPGAHGLEPQVNKSRNVLFAVDYKVSDWSAQENVTISSNDNSAFSGRRIITFSKPGGAAEFDIHYAIVGKRKTPKND